MGLLSRLATYFMPRKVVEVEASSTLDNLQREDHDTYWAKASGGSADAMASPEFRRLTRNRARMEVQNNAWLQGMLETYVSMVLGTGVRLQIIPEESSKSQLAAANKVEKLWNEWVEETEYFTELRSMIFARVQDGESFGVLETAINDVPVQLQMRAYEADFFGDPWGRSAYLLDRNRWYDGIRFDSSRRAASYFKFKEHPGAYLSRGLGGDGSPIPADYVCHLLKKRRPGQSRALTELLAVLDLMVDLRRYRDAAVKAARKAANISVFIESNMEPGEADELEEGPFTTIPLPQDAIMNLPDGWKGNAIKAEHPTMTYDAFTLAIMREAARCIPLPIAVATGDSSQMNYASGRLDKQAGDLVIDCDRKLLDRTCNNKTFREWYREAQSIPGFLPRLGKFKVRWQYDGRRHVDPMKEANAVSKLSEANLLDEERYWSETFGLSLDEAYEAIARVREAKERHGLTDIANVSTANAKGPARDGGSRRRKNPKTPVAQQRQQSGWENANE